VVPFSSKHLVLIRTPTVLPTSSVTAQQGVPSLALAYLASAAKTAGHRVTCVDALAEHLGTYRSFGEEGLLLAGLTVDEVIERVPKDCDAIGVSCAFSNDWIYSRRILEALHSSFPDVPLIVGGEHVSADPEFVLTACPFIRCCVLGEGERALIDVVEALSRDRELTEVPGVACLDPGGRLRRGPTRNPVPDLDKLGWPDWESAPLVPYLDAGYGMAIQGVRSLPMLASRGCPYRCSFCSSPRMWTPTWRPRNVAEILAEARHYREKYGVEHLEFYDLSPGIDPKWLESFCHAVGELDLTWNFPSGMRSEALSRELLERMRASGCYKLTLAFETSSPRLVRAIRKQTQPGKILSAVRDSVRAGLITKANFIWGLPAQRRRDLLADFLFLLRLALAGMHDVTCFAFVPYPGSELHDQLVAQGQIRKTGQDAGYERFLAFNVYNNPRRMRSWSAHLKDGQLSVCSLGGMALFYAAQFFFRPWRLPRLIAAIWRSQPVTMLELALAGIRRKGPRRRPVAKMPPDHGSVSREVR
jgi:anaerobic magnesium-protoporphyrin IX monomethyl ester cyclase